MNNSSYILLFNNIFRNINNKINEKFSASSKSIENINNYYL